VLVDQVLEASVLSNTGYTAEKWLRVLTERSSHLRTQDDFPVGNLRLCAAIENEIGSDRESLLRFYVWLASGCLTTAFVLTQRDAAWRRMESSSNEYVRRTLLPLVASGDAFVTVGISHLTTSRRHLAQPPMRARLDNGTWIIDGYCPWVTGGAFARWLVVGAVVEGGDEGDEIMVAIPAETEGVFVEPGLELMALTASSTGAVRFDSVRVPKELVLHGPVKQVMNVSTGGGSGAGGLQTSALAIGLSGQAIRFLSEESVRREELAGVVSGFQEQWDKLFHELVEAGRTDSISDPGGFRKSANDLALHSTLAALAAAKGAAYVGGHDVGRWCREAMFFLVWSCPQSVVQSHLCTFAS
jgi:alkylation response protein AidB-like acyl-CoA dehydrogenase